MFGEVLEVLRVERCQRQTVDQATGGDPTVIDRAWTAAELGVGLHLAPLDRYGFVEGEQSDVLPPPRKVSQSIRSPVAQDGPLGQFAEGDERDEKRLSG